MPPIANRDNFPPLQLTNIHGAAVSVPDAKAAFVHLQFRRFAGCSICNLHLQRYIMHHARISAAGVREVVVFHSSREALLPYQGSFPFDVIADPSKQLYTQFGVVSSWLSMLHPAVWATVIKSQFAVDKPRGEAENGPWGLPAEYLIDNNGRVVQSHYGKHAYDQWSVDTLLQHAEQAQKSLSKPPSAPAQTP